MNTVVAMLQTLAACAAISKRARTNPVGNSDMLRLDLHNFHQAANDFSAGVPVSLVHALPDLLGELVHVAEHQAKLGLLGCLIRSRRCIFLQSLDPLPGAAYAGLELHLVQQPAFVGVDQATDAASRGSQLLVHLHDIHVRLLFSVQTPLEFVAEICRVLKHGADIFPYGGIEPIHSDRLVCADGRAAEPIGIQSGTAVIAVHTRPESALAVISVPATAAFQQPLKQMPCRAMLLPTALAVLGQLLGDGVEQFFADDGWNGDHDLVFRRGRVPRRGIPRVFRTAASRAQSGTAFARACLAKDSLALVSGIYHQVANSGSAPASAPGAANALAVQATSNFPQCQAVSSDPFEYLPHHLGLLEIHLILRLPAAFVLADVAVSVRCMHQHVDRSTPCRVPLAATAALHDLCTLVLGDHPLHLKEQIFFGTGADGVVQKDQFHPAALKFLNQQHLPGVFAGQTIRGMHVQPLEATGPGHVTQPFQGGAHQRAAGVAVVDEAQFVVKDKSVGLDALPQVRDLAVDGSLLGLLIGRDASVDRRANQRGFRRLGKHNSRSLGHEPGSSPAICRGNARLRPRRGHVPTNSRHRQVVCPNQHLGFQPTPDEFPPHLQRRMSHAALTIHGSAFPKEGGPQLSYRKTVTPVNIPDPYRGFNRLRGTNLSIVNKPFATLV